MKGFEASGLSVEDSSSLGMFHSILDPKTNLIPFVYIAAAGTTEVQWASFCAMTSHERLRVSGSGV